MDADAIAAVIRRILDEADRPLDAADIADRARVDLARTQAALHQLRRQGDVVPRRPRRWERVRPPGGARLDTPRP